MYVCEPMQNKENSIGDADAVDDDNDNKDNDDNNDEAENVARVLRRSLLLLSLRVCLFVCLIIHFLLYFCFESEARLRQLLAQCGAAPSITWLGSLNGPMKAVDVGVCVCEVNFCLFVCLFVVLCLFKISCKKKKV